MLALRNKKNITPEQQATLDTYRANVAFAERKGQKDTIHHWHLAQFLKSLEEPKEVEKESKDGE